MSKHKETTMVEIDFEVYQCIVQRQRGFSETPNAVLRRVFELSPSEEQEVAAPPEPPRPAEKPWRGKGVELPHGTEVRMEYWGIWHEGIIQDGDWVVKGEHVRKPSSASRIVTNTQRNGWNDWEVKRPSDSVWRRLDSLRTSENRSTRALRATDLRV